MARCAIPANRPIRSARASWQVGESAETDAAVSERSDEELMRAFIHGEAEAFDLLLARHQRALHGYLLHAAGDRGRAEDLFQEVFLRVIRHRDRFAAEGRFKPWLYRIARNAAIDAHRRGRLRMVASLDAPGRGEESPGSIGERVADPGADPAELAESAELRALVREALDQLPAEQREVLLLRCDGELGFAEIAAIVGCPLETAKSRMRYALASLRRRLGPAPVILASGAGA
jgi:RNA polymerase sigma-70 factor (ECF subfamily)